MSKTICPHCYQKIEEWLYSYFKERKTRCPYCFRFCLPQEKEKPKLTLTKGGLDVKEKD